MDEKQEATLQVDIIEVMQKATWYDEIMNNLVRMTQDKAYFGRLQIAQVDTMSWAVSVDTEVKYFRNPYEAVAAFVDEMMTLELVEWGA